MRYPNFLFLLFCCSIVGCSFQNDSNTSIEEQTSTIIIQAFTDLPQEKLEAVVLAVKKVYPKVKVESAIDLPKTAYTSPRNRYRADALIYFLKCRAKSQEVIIGLTTKDISTKKGSIADYGIMGLGYQPGSACVISSFRLSKNNTSEQFTKVALHELGHTQGLPHCSISYCYMRDAEGKNYLDQEIDFCPSCKAHLQAKGCTL